MEFAIKEIMNHYSSGELFWDVIASLITSALIFLFSKPTPKHKSSISKTWIEIIGVTVSLLTALFSISFFVFLHIFTFYQDGLENKNLEPYFSANSLINLFLISYAAFLLFQVIHSIRLMVFKKATFTNLFHDLLVTVLLGALLIITLLITKMGIDSASGKAVQNENIHTYIVDFYLLRLFRLAIISAAMLFPIMIFKLRRKD